MRSTPIQQMEKTTDLQPLECRREYKAAIQGEKLKRLTSHPLHLKLQHGTKNHLKRKSFKRKLKDLQKENADLLEADPGKCEELTMSVWALRKSLLEVRTEIPGLAAKGTQAPELQKALTLEMIQSCYPKSTWTHVFTDGSAENGYVSLCPRPIVSPSHCAPVPLCPPSHCVPVPLCPRPIVPLDC